MARKIERDKNAADSGKEHSPTEDQKHQAGGPGKSARSGEGKGNQPGQKQGGPGRDLRRGDPEPRR